MPPADLYDFHRKGKYPSHTTAVIGILFVFGVYLAMGAYALLNLWSQYGAFIMSLINSIGIPEILNSNLLTISVLIGSFIFFSMVLALIAAALAKKLGGTLILIGAIVMNIVTLAPIIMILSLTGWSLQTLMDTWVIMLPFGFTLLITVLMFTVFRDRVNRAGRIISLTGEVCLKEKEVFIPPLISMIFSLFSALIFAAIVLYFMYPNGIANDAVLTNDVIAIVLINFVIYLFITIFVYKFTYATSSAITYIYIRGRNPSLGDGFRGALGAVAGIAALSIMGVIVRIVQIIIRAISRKGPPGSRRAGDAAAGVIGWVWALINYFTIPVMVVENVGATKGIKKSFKMLRGNFVDVVIKETGVRWGFSVLILLIVVGFAGAGAFTGWLQTGDLAMSILYAIGFLFLGAFPVSIIIKTFDIVYITILYVFIRMKDGSISRTAIPSQAKKVFDTAYSRAKKA